MSESFRVGITGAAGYMGSRICKKLLEKNHEIVPLDNFHDPKIKDIKGITIKDIDIRNRSELRDAFKDVDIVMHLAALSSVEECEENPEDAFDINVQGTENVSWICREKEAPLIFPCSMAVLGNPSKSPIRSDLPRNPLDIYGLTKNMSEEDIEKLSNGKFPAHIPLISNLYGHHVVDGKKISKRTVMNIFVNRALNKEPLTVHKPGTQSRDFIHVKDVTHAYLKSMNTLMRMEKTGTEKFTLASGECMSVRELAELVKKVTRKEKGYEPEIEMVENPRNSKRKSRDFKVDTSEAKNIIGFEAEHSIESTVRDLITSQ